ncbi:aminotransferase class V-fold PLP-dependent enzyme [bacterium]|nr:aminotransferase class V-fold PLP-dependent enzyme [bacterium]
MDNGSLIYLDNAATSWPKPDSVYDFMIDFYRNNGVNPGRSGFDAAIDAGNLVEKTRVLLNDFFHGDTPERTVFCHNATDGLNLIIRGLVRKGDHVISTCVEHNSVLRPLNELERDGVIEVTWLPFDEAGFVSPDAVRSAMKSNTTLVIVNHGSNVIGTVQDVAAIGKIVKETPATFVIDASQTAGVIPINMQEMNIDVLVATGHKALMGPTGTGVIVVRDHVDIAQTRAGGTGVRSAYPYHLPEYPYRLEYGTMNLMGVAGLFAGQQWIEEQGGPAAIHEREMVLTRKLVDGLKAIDNITLYCCDNLENHIATVSINVPGVEAMNVGIMLDVDHNIATRTGLQCAPKAHEGIGSFDLHGTVRFSLGPFTTAEHIDTAIDAMKEIAQMGKKAGAPL